MKMFAFLCLFLASMVGQQTSSAPPPAGEQSNGQKAKAILDQMIQTLGGQAYLTVEDYYAEGRSGSYHAGTVEGTTLFFHYWKKPDKDRYELTKQRDVVELYVADNAYELTYRGTRPVDVQKDEKLKQSMLRRHYTLELVLRQWLNEPGVLLLDEGPGISEGHLAEKITVINAQNESVTIYVDPTTHLPLEKHFSTRDPRYRERDEDVTIYGDWKMIQGINTPRIVVNKHNGEILSQQIVFNVTYNMHPSDSLFDPAVAKINPVKEK